MIHPLKIVGIGAAYVLDTVAETLNDAAIVLEQTIGWLDWAREGLDSVADLIDPDGGYGRAVTPTTLTDGYWVGPALAIEFAQRNHQALLLGPRS